MRKLSLVALLMLAQTAWAASVWTGAVDTAWNNPLNWQDGAVPGYGADVTFGTGGSQAVVTDFYMTVGTVLFNRDADFTMSAASNLPMYVNGVTVSTTGRNYTFGGVFLFPGTTQKPFDIAAGSTLSMGANDSPGYGLTRAGLRKTGPGTLNFATRGDIGAVDVLDGAMTGAGFNMTTSANVRIEGALGDGTTDFQLYKFGVGELRFAGTNGKWQKTFTGYQVFNGGSVVCDNTLVNVDNRFSLNAGPWLGNVTFRLLGNADVNSVQALSPSNLEGSIYIDVQHGANANATVSLRSLYGQPGVINFTGNGFGISGTNISRISAENPGYDGLGGNGVIPSYRFGMEFATWEDDVDGTHYLKPLAAEGRPSDLLTSTANSHLLLTANQTLADADVTANSLKIDGAASINLNGKTLIVGSYWGGGIIKTGTSATTISNGTIVPANIPDGDRLYITNDTDLVVQATLKTRTIIKTGSGKLSVGTLDDGFGGLPSVRWYEGSMEFNSDQDIKIDPSEWGTYIMAGGELIKNGTGTLTVNRISNKTTAGGAINKGTLIMQSPCFGSGLVTVADGAVLETQNVDREGFQFALNGTVQLNNSLLKLNGGIFTGNAASAVQILAGKTATVSVGIPGAGYYQNFYDRGFVKDLGTLTGGGKLVVTGPGAVRFSHGGNFTGEIDVQDGGLYVGSGSPAPTGVGAKIKLSGANSQLWAFGGATVADTEISGIGRIGAYYFFNVSDNPDWGTPQAGTTFTAQGCTFKPGNGVGTFRVDTNLALAMSGTNYSKLEIEVGSGPVNDLLAVGFGLSGLENADLIVNVAAGLNLKGQMLTIVTCVNDLTLANTFHHVSFTNNYTGTVSYSLGAIVLSDIKLAAIPGDANHSGLVDQDDYKVWYDNYGTGTTWEQGNFKGSGVTDQDDYKTWYDNYGVGTAGGAVPEPATMALLALGGLAMLRRKG